MYLEEICHGVKSRALGFIIAFYFSTKFVLVYIVSDNSVHLLIGFFKISSDKPAGKANHGLNVI